MSASRNFCRNATHSFVVRSIVSLQSGQVNFSLFITKATGCSEYFGQCGQETGISKTRPNSSLGMTHPRPLHSPVIILPGTFGSIFDYTDIEQPVLHAQLRLLPRSKWVSRVLQSPTMSASLIGRFGSSAFRQSTTPVSMSHRRLDGVRFKTRTQDAAERRQNVRLA